MVIDSNVIDTLLREAAASPRLRMNLDLRNNGECQSQRMLNGLQPGTVLPIHRHRRSLETCIVLCGKMDEVYYDDNGVETQRIHLGNGGAYGVQIPAGRWHSIEVLEPTVIIEVKDGEYMPLTEEDMIFL